MTYIERQPNGGQLLVVTDSLTQVYRTLLLQAAVHSLLPTYGQRRSEIG